MEWVKREDRQGITKGRGSDKARKVKPARMAEGLTDVWMSEPLTCQTHDPHNMPPHCMDHNQ